MRDSQPYIFHDDEVTAEVWWAHRAYNCPAERELNRIYPALRRPAVGAPAGVCGAARRLHYGNHARRSCRRLRSRTLFIEMIATSWCSAFAEPEDAEAFAKRFGGVSCPLLNDHLPRRMPYCPSVLVQQDTAGELASGTDAVSGIADDLTPNEWIRIIALVVAVSPNWKTVRRLALPVRPGAKPA
jgi:hypothetical protein